MTIETLEIGLRAVVGVIGSMPASTRQLGEAVIELWQRAGGQGRVPKLDELAPLDAAEVAARLPAGPLRVQLIRLCVAAILLDRQRDLARIARLEQLAEALAIAEPAIGDLNRWARGQHFRLRRNLVPRLWAIDELRARAAEVGWFEVIWVFVGMFTRTHDNPEVLARYQTLAELSPDTLGGGLIHQLRGSGFSLPGERGSPEDYMVRHDLVHVLAGLGTDARSEVEAGSFMAGCRRYDGFALLVFVLLQFHCGLRVTPVAPGEIGLVDPRRMLDALRRSVFMTIDPSVRDWNYEADFAEPLDRLRERYRIAPSRFASPASPAA
ncbi:hypothetical protein ACNOYE_33800 [Nannocystaceae bacterium ST9]